MYHNSLNNSNEVSFLSHKSSKIDGKIIEKLMMYIENTLETKLNKIEKLIEKNKVNFSKVKKKYLEAERKVMNYKRQKLGSNLISDDIKFFFNLVKSKPKDKIIKGVFLKDGRPSPRFGGQDEPFPTRSRSKSKVSKRNRKVSERKIEKNKEKPPVVEQKLTFSKSKPRTPFKKRSEVSIRKNSKAKRNSISRGKSQHKSPMKRWEKLYNMANEKANKKKIPEQDQDDIENNTQIINLAEDKGKSTFGAQMKNLESTQKKPRTFPAILDNQQSPSKKLKNQRKMRRSKRLLDSKEMRRRNKRDKRCFQKITKMEEEYQKGIRYCESSDSSCENLKTKEVSDGLYHESSEFHFSLKQNNNPLKMASTESEQNQTKQYLDMMKPPRSKLKSIEALNPTTDTTMNNSDDFSNLENYTTDRPNHISPIRQKRDQHPLVALGEYNEEDEDISNTERLIHQTVGTLNDDSFSRDKTGKRLIDGMLEVDCEDSRVFHASGHKSRPDDTWKEIEAERMQVVKMLEGMMRSTGRGDYSSAENIFKHYESFRKGEENSQSQGNGWVINSNLEKVSERTAEYSESDKQKSESFEEDKRRISPNSAQSDLESELGLRNNKNQPSKKTSVSNFVSFKDSNFGVRTLPKHTMSEQERTHFHHISISEKSEACKTEGFDQDSFSNNSILELKREKVNPQKRLNKDPSLVFKSKAERVIIFEEESQNESDDGSNCFYSSFGSKEERREEERVEILTRQIMKNCGNKNVNIIEVRKSVKMILAMPKEVQQQLLKNSYS